jgi:hypothetical protein
MSSWSFIVEKTSTLLDETIHIMHGCVVHLHGHRNKMVPFLKPSIFLDLDNGAKFRNYTYWSTNDIQKHHFLCWVSNHQIDKENLVVSSHVKIDF